MFLKDIEPGAHSPLDWHKRLCNSYIYGTITNLVEKPSVIWIKSISEYESTSSSSYEAATVAYKTSGNGDTKVAELNRLFVMAFKPDVGIYNLSKFPIKVSHLPYRQWHFGVTQESLQMSRLDGRVWGFTYDNLLPCYDPYYPTLVDAVNMLKERERKHIALSQRVSLLNSGLKKDRFLLLYQFIPIASINNGMWFLSKVGKPFEKVAMEYQDNLMALL